MTGRPSELERRRKKFQNARADASTSEVVLIALDNQLRANVSEASRLEAELTAAQERVAELKKSLRANGKEHDTLRESRQRLRARSAQAQSRATEAESRYDQAILADIVDRGKQRDLAEHPRQVAAVPPAGR